MVSNHTKVLYTTCYRVKMSAVIFLWTKRHRRYREKFKSMGLKKNAALKISGMV